MSQREVFVGLGMGQRNRTEALESPGGREKNCSS